MPTGAAALLRGGRPGPTVALRADIDAIAQQEAPREGARSEVPGVMHGCGTIFIPPVSGARPGLLSQRREALAGNVVFLFQPPRRSRKAPGPCWSTACWRSFPPGPAACSAFITAPSCPPGPSAVMEGPVMAGKSHFTITLHGKAGHGGSPAQVRRCDRGGLRGGERPANGGQPQYRSAGQSGVLRALHPRGHAGKLCP